MKYIPDIFIKIATLSLFILLVSGFVAYRAGVLPVGLAQPTRTAGIPDTLPPADSLRIPVGAGSEVAPPRVMPSSKSMILLEPEDTLARRKRDSLNRIYMMSSSKSGPVFPRSIPAVELKADSAKEVKTVKKVKKAKKQKNRKP